ATQVGVDADDLGINYHTDFAERIRTRAERDKEIRIASNIPELDDMTNGGIKKGQTGLIVGGTGRGKSLLLSYLSRQAVLLGKTVVYISCELSANDIADRFDSMISHVKMHELDDYQDQLMQDLSEQAEVFGSKLWIKHYPAGSCTVGMIKLYLKQL